MLQAGTYWSSACLLPKAVISEMYLTKFTLLP